MPFREALKARRVSRLVHVRGGGPRVDALVARAQELRIVVDTVDRMALDRLARGSVHQGVAADLEALPAFTVEELARGSETPALLVVLDGIEDPQNVGAILRSADAAGATGIIRQARHAAPLHGATAKASAGAVSHVRVATVVNIARAIEELKELGVWTVGLDAEAGDVYDAVDYTVPTAFVAGRGRTGAATAGAGAVRSTGEHPDGGARAEPERLGFRWDCACSRRSGSGGPVRPVVEGPRKGPAIE